MLLNKKGEGMWWQIILLVLGIVGLLIIIAVLFPNLFNFGDSIKSEAGKIAADPDLDGFRGMSDACPCTYGNDKTNGCPANFTEQQIKDDRAKYNTDTACGKDPTAVASTTSKTKTFQGVTFKQYRSIEISGDDAWGPDPEEAEIMQACIGWVGLDCASSCTFNNQPMAEECWVMVTELEYLNDCGQALVDEGKIISQSSFNKLGVDIGNKYSPADLNDPKNLLQAWSWKSKPIYGSLLCYQGLWFGCTEAQKDGNITIGTKVYRCKEKPDPGSAEKHYEWE